MAAALAGTDEGAGGLAARALAVVITDPRAALRLGAQAREEAGGDPATGTVAARAMGLAALELGDLEAAESALYAAVTLAVAAGEKRNGALARMSLARLLLERGDVAAARGEAEQAIAGLDGAELAQALMQRALIEQRMGRLDAALTGYDAALAVFRDVGAPSSEARLLVNRGILHAYRGELTDAEDDLCAADELVSELGLEMRDGILQNRAFVAARGGDTPAALRFIDEAAAVSTGGHWRASILCDKAHLLLGVPLVEEAKEAAEAAVNGLDEAGAGIDLCEAQLILAEALLASGDRERGRSVAAAAQKTLAAAGRDAWAALAARLEAAAAWDAGDQDAEGVERLRTAAVQLEAVGWHSEAASMRLSAAEGALRLGDATGARADLLPVARARRTGPAAFRGRAWEAEARLRLASGDRAGARRALTRSLDALDAHRAALGAADLRAHAGAWATEPARLGVRMALEDERAAEVLAWAERHRAGALHLPPARPPEDAALAEAFDALRRLAGEREEALKAGQDATALERRQAELERLVRERSRHADGAAFEAGTRVTPAALREALAGRVLVEIVEHDGDLHAVTITPSRTVLRRLSAASVVTAELDGLRFALRRLGAQAGTPRSLDAMADAADVATHALDDALLVSLRDLIRDRPLVLVPTGALHALPWGALPSCAGRAVTVAPSAALWLRAEQRGDADARRHEVDGLAAGPGLPHAEVEVRALADAHPRAATLMPEEATAAAVCRLLEGSRTAHIACHGRFRADNPLFSSLQLADGPLSVYDLQRLDRAPDLLVLSACDSGLSAVHPGDELMGLAAALFPLGTAALVASIVPVPDEATHRLMLAFHSALASGDRPAAALARAAAHLDPTRPADRVAAAGFLCLGAG